MSEPSVILDYATPTSVQPRLLSAVSVELPTAYPPPEPPMPFALLFVSFVVTPIAITAGLLCVLYHAVLPEH